MGALDNLTGKHITVNGVPMPDRKTLRFTGGVTASDAPSEETTDLVISAGGGGSQDIEGVLALGNNAGGEQLKNLGAATDPNDAVTKLQAESISAASVDAREYATMAALRAVTVINGRRVYISGHTVAGLGAGDFRGVTGAAPGTYVDDGGNTVVPALGNGSAAWLRLEPQYYFEDFGARGDGVTDDTAAVQAAIDALPTVGGIANTGVIQGQMGDYLISSTIDLVSRRYVTFKGYGSRFTYTHASGAGKVFDLSHSHTIQFQGWFIQKAPASTFDGIVFDCYGSDAISPCYYPTFRDMVIGADTQPQNAIRFDGTIAGTLDTVVIHGHKTQILGRVTQFSNSIIIKNVTGIGYAECIMRGPHGAWLIEGGAWEPGADGRACAIILDDGFSAFALSISGVWIGDDGLDDYPWIQIQGTVYGLDIHGVTAYSSGGAQFMRVSGNGVISGGAITGNSLLSGNSANPTEGTIHIGQCSGLDIGNNAISSEPKITYGAGCNYSSQRGHFGEVDARNDVIITPRLSGVGGRDYGGHELRGALDLGGGALPANLGRTMFAHCLDVAGFGQGSLAIYPNRLTVVESTASTHLGVVSGGNCLLGLQVHSTAMTWHRDTPLQTSAGADLGTAALPWNRLFTAAPRAATGATTLTLADDRRGIDLTGKTNQDVTIPANGTLAIPVGARVSVTTTTFGRKRIVAAGGVVLTLPPGKSNRLNGKSAVVQLRKIATDEWIADGDFAAADAFDAFALTGLVIASDSDLDVTLNAGNVSALNDQSGQANHWIQATAGAQPAYVPSWRNGRSAIQGATGDRLGIASLSGGNVSQPVTIVIVGEWEGSSATTYMLLGSAAGAIDIRNQFGDPAMTAGAVLGTGQTIATGTPFILFAEFSAGASRLRIEPHGLPVQQLSGNPGTSGLNGIISLLNNDANNLPFLGKIARVIAAGRLLTPIERLATLQQCRDDYQIAASNLGTVVDEHIVASPDQRYLLGTPPGASTYNASVASAASLTCDFAPGTPSTYSRITWVVRVGDYVLDYYVVAKRDNANAVTIRMQKELVATSDYSTPPSITVAATIVGAAVRLTVTQSTGGALPIRIAPAVITEDAS